MQRGTWSPWAAIVLRGYSTAVPSEHMPLMDLQGSLDDGTSRNTAFLHVLNEVKPHAYVLLVGKEANKDVIDKLGSTHKISEALVVRGACVCARAHQHPGCFVAAAHV
jgi:ribonucleotide monophosphatase NagD (HAD superfamily)